MFACLRKSWCGTGLWLSTSGWVLMPFIIPFNGKPSRNPGGRRFLNPSAGNQRSSPRDMVWLQQRTSSK